MSALMRLTVCALVLWFAGDACQGIASAGVSKGVQTTHALCADPCPDSAEAKVDDLPGWYTLWEADQHAGFVHVMPLGEKYLVSWSYSPKVDESDASKVIVRAAVHGQADRFGKSLAVAWGGTASAYEIVKIGHVRGKGEEWRKIVVPSRTVYSPESRRSLYSSALCAVHRHGLPVVDSPQVAGCSIKGCDCGCKDGKDCRCAVKPKAETQEEKDARLDALSLITTPGLAAEAIPEELPEATRKAIEQVCRDLELWTAPGGWEKWPTPCAGWVQWAAGQYAQRYGIDLTVLPKIDDATLPPHDFAAGMVETLQAAQAWSWQAWGTSEEATAMRWDLSDHADYWQLVRDAANRERPEIARRLTLHRLRQLAGDRIFYSGNWNAYGFEPQRR